MQIKIFNRETKKFFIEKVYGDRWISLFYSNPVLRVLVKSLFVQKLISKAYGFYQGLRVSRAKVDPFISNFNIQMEKFITPSGGYKSFDDFFIRELKPEQIKFSKLENELSSPCEARLSVHKIYEAQSSLAIKGKQLSLLDLVGKTIDLKDYEGGYSWVFRLCPVDYHRFHFPDDGVISLYKKLKGKLHSVNPISLEKIPKVFLENERQLSVLKSKNFGDIIYLEVGALCVGTIEQLKSEGDSFIKSEQKGMFHFGGSTVVMLTKKQVKPCDDLIEKTTQGFECLVHVGDALGATTEH